MMNKVLAVAFIFSLMLNIYLYRKGDENNLDEEGSSRYVYAENITSIDNAITPHIYFPRYRGYSITGEITEFLDFNLRGTIISSVKNKYDIDVSTDLVRNIQEIVYFFNDFRLAFNEGDRVSLFYRLSDQKIVYLRFENSRRRSVHETFLFNVKGEEKYVTSDGAVLQPCITNGPFKACPQIRFSSKQGSLIPVFETGQYSEATLPFMAKITSVSNNSLTGGTIELTYSNHLVRAVFEGLSEINTGLQKDRIYKQGAYLGRSGYPLPGGRKGIVYYLRRRDNSVMSPFSFHHTEKSYVPENRLDNLNIASNFYVRWLQNGIDFERLYY